MASYCLQDITVKWNSFHRALATLQVCAKTPVAKPNTLFQPHRSNAIFLPHFIISHCRAESRVERYSWLNADPMTFQRRTRLETTGIAPSNGCSRSERRLTRFVDVIGGNLGGKQIGACDVTWSTMPSIMGALNAFGPTVGQNVSLVGALMLMMYPAGHCQCMADRASGHPANIRASKWLTVALVSHLAGMACNSSPLLAAWT